MKKSELDELIDDLEDRLLEHDVIWDRRVVVLEEHKVREIVERLRDLSNTR